MVKYVCPRCGFSTIYKNNMRNHKSRKFKCKPIVNNIELESLSIDDFELSTNETEINIILNSKKNDHQDPQFDHQDPQFEHQDPQFDHQDPPNKHQNPPNNYIGNSIICTYCNKIFSRKDSLKRHIEKVCSKKFNEGKENMIGLKLKLQDKEDEIIKLKKEIELLGKSKCVNNIKNVNNEITINNYGYENLDYLTNNIFLRLLKMPSNAITKLIEYKYFHPDHPENHNIKITNIHNKYAKIYKNNKWLLNHKKDLIEELVDNGYADFEEFRDLNEYEISNKVLEKYKLMESKYNKNKDKIIENTELSIINNTNKY